MMEVESVVLKVAVVDMLAVVMAESAVLASVGIVVVRGCG
jgi:hypothetical protein